jgi:hypothetical protein
MRRLLVDLANLRNDGAKADEFLRNYGKYFPSLGEPDLSELASTKIQDARAKNGLKLLPLSDLPDLEVAVERHKQHYRWRFFALGNCLWSIFRARGLRERHWLLDHFEGMVIEISQPALPVLSWETLARSTQSSIELPPRSYLEIVTSYLRDLLAYARYCPNSDCRRPCYIARHGNQKFCSRKCAEPFRLKANRRWWDDHGRQWREARRRAKKSRRKRGTKT